MNRSELKDVLLIAALAGSLVLVGVKVVRLRDEVVRLRAHEIGCPYTESFFRENLTTDWAQGKVTYEFWYCDGKAVKARSTQPDPRTPGQALVLEITEKDIPAIEKTLKKVEVKP